MLLQSAQCTIYTSQLLRIYNNQLWIVAFMTKIFTLQSHYQTHIRGPFVFVETIEMEMLLSPRWSITKGLYAITTSDYIQNTTNGAQWLQPKLLTNEKPSSINFSYTLTCLIYSKLFKKFRAKISLNSLNWSCAIHVLQKRIFSLWSICFPLKENNGGTFPMRCINVSFTFSSFTTKLFFL